jgi:hypothetical protein
MTKAHAIAALVAVSFFAGFSSVGDASAKPISDSVRKKCGNEYLSQTLSAGGANRIRSRGPAQESEALKTRWNFRVPIEKLDPEKISRPSCSLAVVYRLSGVLKKLT